MSTELARQTRRPGTVRVGVAPDLEGRTAVATQVCLVISTRADRREMLSKAARDAGWQTVVCSEPADGWGELQRGRLQLTLLDIQDCTLVELEEFQSLAAQLVGQAGSLLVVCGNQGDPCEEVWARQLGAWLYLPGVEAETDVAMLCEEARVACQRLQARFAPSAKPRTEQRGDEPAVGRW
jgi:hypothetical protein